MAGMDDAMYEQAARLFAEGEEHAARAQSGWPWRAFNPAIWALEGAAHICSSSDEAKGDGDGRPDLVPQVEAALAAARESERKRPGAWLTALRAHPRRSKACIAERTGWPKPRSRRAVLRLQEVLDFCFPEGVEHPKAAARLFLLCEYGPLQDGWLWGGPHNARRKLTPYEIETMVTKLEREDIIKSVAPVEHGRSSMLPPTPEEENEVLAGIPESIKKPYRLRVPHIVAMLANCSTEPWEEPVEPEPDARIAVVDAYVLAFGAAVPPAEGAGNEEGAVGWLTDLNAPAAEGEEPAPGPAVEELVATIAAQLAPSTAEGQEAVRPPGLSEEACAAFDAVELDGEKLAAAIVAKLPSAADEEGIARLTRGSGADPSSQLAGVLRAIWGEEARYSAASERETDLSVAVSSYRREGATPEPESPEPEPMAAVNLFGPGGALNLAVVEQVWLCFHQTQHVVSLVRAARVATLRRMGESSLGLSRRRAVDQGEIYNHIDDRTMSRDRKVEDIAEVRRANRTATKLRTVFSDQVSQVEPVRKQKMLHAHTFKITNIQPNHGPTHEGNHPGILQNTILVDMFRTYPYFEMRTQTGRIPPQGAEALPGGEWVNKAPWDRTATLTETHRKHYVKSRNTGPTQKISGISGNVGGLLAD